MLLRNLLVLTSLTLAACGFTPVHKQSNASDLASVKVNTPRGLNEQFFNNHITDLLNPAAVNTPDKYTLDVVLNITQTPLAIQQDRTVTRYKTNVTATYTITEKESGTILDSGKIQREGGYDKVDSDYATYVSEEDTKRRVIKELAEDLKLRTMSVIIR